MNFLNKSGEAPATCPSIWWCLRSRTLNQIVLEDYQIEGMVFSFCGAALVYFDQADAERAAVGKRVEFPLHDIVAVPLPAWPSLDLARATPRPNGVIGIHIPVSAAGEERLSVTVALRGIGDAANAEFASVIADLITRSVQAQKTLRVGPQFVIARDDSQAGQMPGKEVA